MKKILLATTILGFAITLVNAQNPAVVSTNKQTTKATQVADPAVSATGTAANSTGKPARKVTPATVRNGKPVTTQQGTHGKKTKHMVRENKDAAKPLAPGTSNKK